MNKPFLVPSSTQSPQSHSATATPNASRLPDAQAREQALDPSASCIVEAPAGSGKTGLLIQRYLKLLGQENVTEPEQVLAITFTQKATAEIRERVLHHLLVAADPEASGAESDFDLSTRILASRVLERDRVFQWNLLSSPARLNVRTIDSVCAEIARTLPVLSESGGSTSPTPEARKLYNEAARRTLLKLGDDDQPLDAALQILLLHRDGNLQNCQNLLADMLSSRDQWGDLIPLSNTALTEETLEHQLRPRLERSLELTICHELSRFVAACPPHLLHQLTTVAADLAQRDGYNGEISPLLPCSGRYHPPGQVAADLELWRALFHLLVTSSKPNWRKRFNRDHICFEATKADRDRLGELVESFKAHDHLLAQVRRILALPAATYPDEQWTVLKALFRILRQALVQLQLVFAEHATCDFVEIGLLAMQALERDAGNSDLTSALGMRLQHLLVDEMQDTSTTQYRLLELLTQNWDGHSQTVFLVGDPKQSIYLFRQARVERFLHMMQTRQLGDLSLNLLRLTANFRSRPALVESFNHGFARLFTTEHSVADQGISYTHAVAVRDAFHASVPSPPSVNWHIRLTPSTSHKGPQPPSQDPAEIRSIVQQWLTRPLPPGRTTPWKIAVLVSNRKHLQDILPAFRLDTGNGAIPFRAIDIEPLADRQEVLDLVALTRALLHPADRPAWLGLLRSPWVGLGLADLHLLLGGDDPGFAERCVLDLVFERGHLLNDLSAARLERFWTVMHQAASLGQQTSISLWVEQTWSLLGGPAALTALQKQNAQRYLQLLHELEQEEAPFSSPSLQDKLKRLFAEPSLEPGAVDVLTIHKAKGLEWDVVIVPALHRYGVVDKSPLLTCEELSFSSPNAATLIFAPVPGKGDSSHRLNKYLRDLHAAREAAERQRLFYVACTRAREELHLFAAPSLKVNGEVRLDTGSLLQAAWPAVADRFPASTLPSAVPQESSPEAGLIDSPLQLAAAAATEPAPPVRYIQRLPLTSLPALPYPPNLTAPDSSPLSSRLPEASFSVRSFGNAVHTFLDLAASELASGTPLPLLRELLPSWLPRISSVLRAAGLAPSAITRSAQQVFATLQSTLEDPVGAWILQPHPGGATEFALISMQQERKSIRLDRLFLAGSEPLSEGQECLWIIDYKTASQSPARLPEFLAEQRKFYAPQLENYAQTLSEIHPGRPLRLALYYPVMAHLDWWIPTSPQPDRN